MIDPKIKAWIDNASYTELLRKWRFAPIGDPYFQGETGDYYLKIMSKKRSAIDQTEHVRVSKKIGWKKES